MKNSKFNFLRRASLAAPLLVALSSGAYAQLTWDPDNNLTSDGGFGLWDVGTTANWWDGVSATNTTWTNGSAAIFGDSGGDYRVDIADGGVTVGNLTFASTGVLTLESITDDLGVVTIQAGGATWDTGGGEIEFFNDGNVFNTPLAMTSGDTLTVTGGGTFDTGQNPTGADWAVTGAILDVTSPAVLRGHVGSVGKFALVKMAADSTYFHERNASQTYVNNWQLTGSGFVTFDNRYNVASDPRNVALAGIVSGTAGVRFYDLTSASNGGKGYGVLNNVSNSFEGGIIVDGSAQPTLLIVANGDPSLGAVPAALDADNITLENGGRLRFNGVTNVDANRGITLNGGGVIILNGGATTLAGPITGTGGLTIGVAEDGSSNTLILTDNGSDYTGGTNIVRGSITAGVANSLPADTILSMLANAGGTTGFFDFNGFDTTVGGLVTTTGSGTRELRNGGASATLTIDVGIGEDYSFSGNINSAGTVSFIKDGPGTQTINRVAGYTTDPGDVTVNAGTLNWNVADSYGALTVNNSGTLILGQTGVTPSFTAAAGSATEFNVAITDWTGTEGTGWPKLTVTGDLATAAGSTFTVKVSDGVTNFTEANKSFVIGTVGGTPTPLGSFSVDASAFTAGTGTWSLGVSGQDLVLSYTSTADPYATWAATNITDIQPAAPAGFGDDADDDGMDNGLEFVLGGNPLVSDLSILPVTTVGATEVTVAYTRSADSVGSTTQAVQWSTDLASWTSIPVTGTDTAVSIDIPRTNAVGGKLFTRLNVVQP